MDGLNPYALPCVLLQYQDKTSDLNEKQEEQDAEPIMVKILS